MVHFYIYMDIDVDYGCYHILLKKKMVVVTCYARCLFIL